MHNLILLSKGKIELSVIEDMTIHVKFLYMKFSKKTNCRKRKRGNVKGRCQYQCSKHSTANVFFPVYLTFFLCIMSCVSLPPLRGQHTIPCHPR
jgi:hypothetical protein